MQHHSLTSFQKFEMWLGSYNPCYVHNILIRALARPEPLILIRLFFIVYVQVVGRMLNVEVLCKYIKTESFSDF